MNIYVLVGLLSAIPLVLVFVRHLLGGGHLGEFGRRNVAGLLALLASVVVACIAGRLRNPEVANLASKFDFAVLLAGGLAGCFSYITGVAIGSERPSFSGFLSHVLIVTSICAVFFGILLCTHLENDDAIRDVATRVIMACALLGTVSYVILRRHREDRLPRDPASILFFATIYICTIPAVMGRPEFLALLFSGIGLSGTIGWIQSLKNASNSLEVMQHAAGITGALLVVALGIFIFVSHL